MMKDKPPSKGGQTEWEEFLRENQQLPIYMGDHMTRKWTKPEKEHDDDDAGEEEQTRNSIRRADSQPTKLSSTRPSQYSCRKLPNGKRKLKSIKEILLHHHITMEDVLQWQESFDALLNNAAGLDVFTAFLESEVADENLKFWLACEELKNSQYKKVEKKVSEIYDTFINVYSPHEINIDYKMREDIIEQLKSKSDVSVFKEAQHQVYTLMHRDSYPRFLSSSYKTDLVNALTERQKYEAKQAKSAKNSSRSSTGLISCCYCRRQDSEQDIANLVEEQRTASTSVINKSMDVPLATSSERDKTQVNTQQSFANETTSQPSRNFQNANVKSTPNRSKTNSAIDDRTTSPQHEPKSSSPDKNPAHDQIFYNETETSRGGIQ